MEIAIEIKDDGGGENDVNSFIRRRSYDETGDIENGLPMKVNDSSRLNYLSRKSKILRTHIIWMFIIIGCISLLCICMYNRNGLIYTDELYDVDFDYSSWQIHNHDNNRHLIDVIDEEKKMVVDGNGNGDGNGDGDVSVDLDATNVSNKPFRNHLRKTCSKHKYKHNNKAGKQPYYNDDREIGRAHV